MEQFKNQYIFNPSKLDKIYYRITSNDKREKIPPEKISSPPYNAIGLLKMEYPHGIISYRTGVLIGENVVLTAGHNLFDPRKNPNAKLYKEVSYQEALGKKLKVMDLTAIAMAQDSGLPIIVFNQKGKGAFLNVVCGDGTFTVMK